MTETRARIARPKDRKQQILAAAADQFHAFGYHNVGIDDIADAVGISGPALYRHFRGKQDVLEATVETVVEQLVSVFEQPDQDLPRLFDSMARVSVQRRSAIVLWQREASHLPAEKRRAIRSRYRQGLEPLRTKIAEARPTLSADDVDLLLWGCQTIIASPGYHSVRLDPARIQALVVQAAAAACRTSGLPASEERQASNAKSRTGRLLPASRREMVLLAADRLFTARGYQAVNMDDIAAAAGIAGPSLYHHFPGKSAILVAQLKRCLDALMYDVSAALDGAERPGHALDALVRSAVGINVEHGMALGALLIEMVNVPADEQKGLRTIQDDYTSEWVALLTSHRPDLSVPEAEVLVQATHTMIGLLSRRRHFLQRPHLADDLIALASAVLGLDVA